MLVWTRIATNDAPNRPSKGRMAPVSAAVVGNNVVFRFAYFLSVSTTVVPFVSEADAVKWVEAHRAPEG
jgi:hypothetical protein